MAENNLSQDSNSITSDEAYLSETENNITICDSIDETLEDDKTSNETSGSNVSQENLSWKGNENIHKIADKEQILSDFFNSLKSTEHPIKGYEYKACPLESLQEKVQQCEENEFETLKSLESTINETCTTGTERAIIDTGKNENVSGSQSVERIEHPTQKLSNDVCFLDPVPENAQINEENELEMSKSLELNVDKTITNGTAKSIIDTGKNENDSGSKSVEHIESPPQDHGNDECFLDPVPENAQMNEENEFETLKSLEFSVDKPITNGTEKSIIDTGNNENDSGSNSVELIESPPQDHGNDECFLDPVPENAQPCKGKDFETSKSIELNVDKICTLCEDKQTIETDQENKEDDSESKLLESIEHPTQKLSNDACFLEPVQENAQMNEENEFEMSKSLELNVDKTITNGTAKSIIDTDKNENDSGSNSVELIESPPQDHGNDECFLDAVPENAQPCTGKELNVDKICTLCEDKQTIETDQENKEDDSESKLQESIEHPTQKLSNDVCFLEPVQENAQINEENEFEMSKSLELNVDKTITNGTAKSIIDTDKNENDSGSNSVELIESPPQDHGNDECFIEQIPEKPQPCKVKVFETSKSIELNVDKICTAYEEESTIETDQKINENESMSRSPKRIELQTQYHGNHRCSLDTVPGLVMTCEDMEFESSKSVEEFEKITDFKSAQTNCEVNNRPFRLKKAEQFIGDSCAANPFSVNKVQCKIRRPVSKSLPKREVDKATKSATYVLNDTVYCTSHRQRVKYWCHHCIAAKCCMCVNIVYNRTCATHLVITMSEHVYERKKTQMTKIQESSKAYLKELESNMSVLKQNEQITQFQELIQKERIQQEFVSLHELLIEEEMKILQKLGKSFEEYTLQTRSVERTFGSVVAEEARLMCKSLDHINKYDPYGQTLTAADIFLNTEWSQLGVKVHKLFESLKPIPGILQDKFTMQKMKVDLKAQFSSVLDPVEVHPIQFTLYLDDKDITAPFKVSDLFICKNTLFSFTEIELEVEMNCNRISIMKETMKLNDYIFNIGDKPYLQEKQRYIIKARACSGCNELKYVNQRVRNVLIVTGDQPISNTAEYLMNTITNARSKLAGSGRYNSLNEQYLKWKESKLWPFSSVHGCEDFYDVSPEELRAIAYSTTRDCYIACHSLLLNDFLENCNKANDERLKLALCLLNRGEKRLQNR